jgi:hypothetical protein
MRTSRLIAVLAAVATLSAAAPAGADDASKEPSRERLAAARSALEGHAAEGAADDGFEATATGTFADRTGDVVNLEGQRLDHARADVTSVALRNEATIELHLTTRTAGSLTSLNWTEGITGIVWSLDVNGDARPEFDVYLAHDGRRIAVDVERLDGTVACAGTASQRGATYVASFPSSCIGSPANLWFQAFFAYDTDPRCTSTPCDGTEIAVDAAPDDLDRFFGPVARGAQVPQPRGIGYWFVARDGGVFTYNARFHGSAVGRTTSATVGMASHPSASGYWVVEATGRVHAFGAARHHGDMAGRRLNAPIVDVEATPTGNGYYLLGADGGIFTFGDAPFHGSTGNIRLNQPVVGLATTRS